MKNRKSKIPNPKSLSTAHYTRDQIEPLLAQYAEECRTVATLTTKLDKLLDGVRAGFAPQLSKHADRALELQQQIQSWAEANRQREFGNKKTLALLHGSLSFRTGQPSVKTARGFTWKMVLEKIKGSPIFEPFLRIKEEVNKEAVLAHKLHPDLLNDLGLRIHQSETFEIKPAATKLDPPQVGTDRRAVLPTTPQPARAA